ncbi:hypothetical protein Tco_0069189, partial [Tanacetum coccineum]
MTSGSHVEYAISKLLQMGTVAEYESEFVILANQVTGISTNLLKSFYISGLKLHIQLELFRLRPTTLEEAFALARIIEARFEDERATTTIANPNDLNKARPDQVEVVSTSMVATYEEHGCQDGLKPITTTSAAGKKGDLGAISSKGGLRDHMQASEK